MASDLTRVDQNLQAIHAVEGSWSLPVLPDEVKLDLAGNSLMTPPALAGLLTGLEADLEEAEKQQPLPTRFDLGAEEPVNPAYGFQRPTSNVGVVVADVLGLPSPQVYDTGAVQRLKQKLADGGYLNLQPEEIQSDRWLPEYSYAARQLNFDEMTKRFQGERPGAISVEKVLGLVDEWLSPRGLYRAAVELDLWWDEGNIRREFADWDEKVAAWRDDPFNPRKLIDMVTGPLDDLLFPALNIALLFTGVGEVVAATRGLQGAVKGAQALAGIYRGSKGLRFLAGGADDIARFAQPSVLSGLVERGGPVGRKAAHVMNQWRKNSGVIMAKKVNQQILRAGFASNVQQLIDADRGGMSLNRFTQLGEQVDTAFTNPMVDWGVDLLLTPPNILRKGLFSKPAKAAIESIQTGFLRAADNQHLLASYERPVAQYLLDSQGPEAAERFKKLVNQNGLKAALRDTMFDGSDEVMGAALSFTTTMAALDHWARRTADVVSGSPLHELDSTTRTAWHVARNTAAARLRHLDPDNIEDMLTHFAKYGVDEASGGMARRADQFQKRYRQIREAYLESAESAAARGGAIPEGHVRFVGHFDPELGRYNWQPLKGGDPIESDPFFVDIHAAELEASLGEDAARVLSGEIDLPDQFSNRYLRRDDNGALRHWHLSEADKVRLFDPLKLQHLRDLAEKHNELRGGFLGEIMNDLSPAALEQYVYEVLPTFGRWDEFVEATGEIRDAVIRGDLANAQFVSPISPANRRLSALPWTPSDKKWVNEMFSMMLELPDDEKLAGRLMESVFAPFARDVDPKMGNFTVAGVDTVTKQEALAFAATAKRVVRMVKSIRRIKNLGLGGDIFRVAGQYVDKLAPTDPVKRQALTNALTEALGGAAITERTAEEITTLAKVMREAGVSMDEVERVLLGKLAEIDALPAWSERFMVPTQLRRSGDLIQELEAKIRELNKQAYFMASEVEGAPQWLNDFLAERNYKLVYGVEFAQPFDLDGIMPHFADVSRRHLRQKRIGDFFARQDPDAVTALKTRKVRESLHAELSKTEVGLKLNLGSLPDPDNADMNRVLSDLWEILREVQDEAQHSLDTLADRNVVARFGGRMLLHQVPFSIDRLASELPFNAFIDRVMGRGYSREQALAMYRALQKSQALGFRTHGLFAIESKLRSRPVLLDGLRLLGVTQDASMLRRGVRLGVGGVPGAIGGHYIAGQFIDEGEDPNSPENLAIRAAGAIAGGLTTGIGIPGVRGLVEGLESGRLLQGKALKYAYTADWAANLRDRVRFALSPIFDASRYSEAIILGQIGELPDGVRNLRVNQSPTSFRRMIAKEARQSGMDPDQARRFAQGEWSRVQGEFAAAARGDFDWEVIDGTARRFSSVGILGFSPADWMASTFGHLRRAGVDADKAYETVRHIYTYGTTGRSAAELSMNFVFFPFSFTKKTLGHMSNFFTDDITRLIVLQDMAATYQLLSERFDLSNEWKDRLPILQKAHRLNLLAYGIGLGQFGGVNAPLIEGALGGLSRLPGMERVMEGLPGSEEIVNMFIPQMIPMNTAEDAEEAWDMIRQMLPVINDVNTLIGSLVDQGYVIASPTHMTRQAEQRRAWEEWRAFQEETKRALSAAGLSWNQATRHPVLGTLIQRERARISAKYPSWKLGMGDGIAHSQAIEMELKERLLQPKSEADFLLGTFHSLVEQMEEAIGSSWDSSPENVPPEFFGLFRKMAIEFAQENPEFLRLYNRFYRRLMGDITTAVG